MGTGVSGRRGRRRCRWVGGREWPRPAPPAVARSAPPPRGSAASAALRSPTGLWPSMAWKRHTSTSGLHTTVSSAGLVAASPGPLSPGAPPPPTSASPMARPPSDEPPAGAGAATASAQAHLPGVRALGGFALGLERGASAGAAEGRPPRRPLAAGPRGAARRGGRGRTAEALRRAGGDAGGAGSGAAPPSRALQGRDGSRTSPTEALRGKSRQLTTPAGLGSLRPPLHRPDLGTPRRTGPRRGAGPSPGRGQGGRPGGSPARNRGITQSGPPAPPRPAQPRPPVLGPRGGRPRASRPAGRGLRSGRGAERL